MATALLCLAFLSCSKKYTALESGNYYTVLPENFINKWQVKNDSIFILTLNPQFQNRGGRNEDSSMIKIHKTVKEGNSYNIYVEQLINKRQKLRFSIIAILRDKENIFIGFNDNTSYATLEECEQQKFINLEDVFCFSLYTQKALDSFRQFRNVKDLDSATVCTLIKNFRNQAEANRKKVEKIAKYDMYLSGSTKELMNRTLINMQINPVDYTMDESNEMFKKCPKLLND
jgi:hypothetical protein